jgi:transcriptional regulator with XRE-family HTH domain
MLVSDLHRIGEKLFLYRKNSGHTQAEIAEIAGLSDRTYADIERGSVNMRVESLLKICRALKITPNDLLTEAEAEYSLDDLKSNVREKMDDLSAKENETVYKLMDVYLSSLK